MPRPDVLETLVSLAKRRGFIFQSSEIYGGAGSGWDYGPLGVELKKNVKDRWWRAMVHARDDIEGLDAATIILGVCLVGATRRFRADAPVSDYLVHDGFDHRAAFRAALEDPAPAIAAWDGLRATMRAADPAGLPWWLTRRARACDWWCGVTDPATALALGEALHSTGALEEGALALEAQGRPGGDLADLLAIAELLTAAGRAGRWVFGGAAGT